ncbi:hypothetical protein [Actinocorallia populi]|uniref:hypothetical protein n=1 Tax=Actinocorallia populi TaxID=2079200 RepID=UPI000D097709|nr:hypothetical protein [Actinocorallia populi]
MMLRAVVVCSLLPLAVMAPAAPASAAPACPVGVWKLTGYQKKAVSKVYDTALQSRGMGGTKVKIAANGAITYDFKKSAKLVTKGRTNSVPIAETALYRRTLKHKASWKGGRLSVKRATATGTALVKTVQKKPEKSTRTEKVAPLVRTEQETVVPGGRVTYTCDADRLHLKRTIRLDSKGGREVVRWRFER